TCEWPIRASPSGRSPLMVAFASAVRTFALSLEKLTAASWVCAAGESLVGSSSMAQVPPAERGMQVPLVQEAPPAQSMSLLQLVGVGVATALILQPPTNATASQNGTRYRARRAATRS